MPIFEQMKGRFAQILTPKVPDDQMRLLVKTMLEVKGVTPPNLGQLRVRWVSAVDFSAP